MSDPKIEIYKAINDIAQDVSANLKELMENIKTALETILSSHYQKNRVAAETQLTATDLLHPTTAAPLPSSMDTNTEKMVKSLQQIHQNLADTNKENMKIQAMLQSLHTEPTQNPETQKAYIDSTNKVLGRLGALNEEYKLLSKEEAKQSLFLSDPKLMKDPQQASAILNKFEEKVAPLIEKSNTLKNNAKNIHKDAQQEVEQVRNNTLRR
jgi:hypothetical protein